MKAEVTAAEGAVKPNEQGHNIHAMLAGADDLGLVGGAVFF